METLILSIDTINQMLNRFIWGPVMLALFLGIGLMFTVRTGFFQLFKIRLWLGNTLFACFKKTDARKTKDKNSISQFQALCTALASTMGTGNIAGVATAIAAGGPGTIFWMWLSAFLGMMTGFAEKTLGIKYRYKNKDGFWVGGAMVYIERGLGLKWLAVLFSIFCAFASFGIGNMAQINSISSSLYNSFDIPPIWTGVVVASLVSLVIMGGIKRIAKVTEKLVPLMSLLYMIGAFAVLAANADAIPSAFSLIMKEAFQVKSVGGGIAGYGVATAMRIGISRGVFSNEAGLGSSVMVHSASDVKEPVIQGMWGMFEVFADTLVVCTLTALVILTSGVYNMETYLANTAANIPNLDGAPLTANCFSSVIPYGAQFVAVSILCFALATLIGWSYYGERAVEYLFGTKAVFPYKLCYVIVIVIGSVASIRLVWEISDTLNGFMAIPNLIALVLLSGEVVQLLRDYLKKQH
ncbi:alanine/glycine:cation symporter family protein [Konateibacter massiliensis]|uniref:alanine/glycine:cation symporter family protein n=1 Tax=Konateibacter massiliensis TaxID=2002841 RepID=UPI001F45B307|nr:sodium:alanine symporter family protein [Konateibacter massiliensis]